MDICFLHSMPTLRSETVNTAAWTHGGKFIGKFGVSVWELSDIREYKDYSD